MTKKLSFLALLATAAMLCAAPALSVKNAFLSDAGFAFSMNIEALNNSFLGEYVGHDALKEAAKLAEFEFNPNDPSQTMFKALLEKSTITVVTAITVSEADEIADKPEDAAKKTVACIQLPQPLGPMVDAAVVALTNFKKEGVTVVPNVINECKGVLATDEDGSRLAMNFSADGRLLFMGLPELLKKQLTNEAAAAAPAKLVAANVSGLPGAFASLSILVTEDLKGAVGSASPEAGGFASMLESLNLSAAGAGENIDVKVTGVFTSPDTAGAVKSMVDENLPQIKAMGPALANGEELKCLDTIVASQNGNAVSVSFSLTQKDIFSIIQLVGKFMNADDGDDDDDGVEVEDVEVEDVEVEEL
ncbi:MAG: hypothetical protein IKO65_02045 [Victivallales bacterium]|nr:hypothetical protein [Victivallales bacterium]